MRTFWAEPQSRCWWIHRSSAVLAPQAGILVVYRSRRCALGRRRPRVLPRRRLAAQAAEAEAAVTVEELQEALILMMSIFLI